MSSVVVERKLVTAHEKIEAKRKTRTQIQYGHNI